MDRFRFNPSRVDAASMPDEPRTRSGFIVIRTDAERKVYDALLQRARDKQRLIAEGKYQRREE